MSKRGISYYKSLIALERKVYAMHAMRFNQYVARA